MTRRRAAPSTFVSQLVFYAIDPFADVREVIAALVATASGVMKVRAPTPRFAGAARANVERVLCLIDAATTLDPLPFETGAQVIGGASLTRATVTRATRDPLSSR